MSSFVVSAKCMGEVVYTLRQSADAREFVGARSPEELAQELWAFNVKAFNLRYEGRYADETATQWLGENACTPMQGLKSLRCLLYQCAEGDLPSERQWTALDHISKAIALGLVMGTAAFEQADWD